VSYIEKRLLETELVLYELLTTILQSQDPVPTVHSTDVERQIVADYQVKQSKSWKIDEWKLFPLATDEQRQQWWQARRALIQAGLSGTHPTNTLPMRDETHTDVNWNNYAAQPEIASSDMMRVASSPNSAQETPLPQLEVPSPQLTGSLQALPNSEAVSVGGNLSEDNAALPIVHPDTPVQMASAQGQDVRVSHGMGAQQWNKYF
jgi:hypothetical protein